MDSNVQRVLVTPQMARDWLIRYRDELWLVRRRVEHMAELMRTGEWTLTPDPICVDDTGRIVDGQQRLAAIVVSGVSVEMLVEHGTAWREKFIIPRRRSDLGLFDDHSEDAVAVAETTITHEGDENDV